MSLRRSHFPPHVGAQAAPRMRIGRRACLGAATLAATLAALAPRRARTEAPTPVRLGILQFGTVQWVAETMRHDGLDAAHGVALRTETLANNEAGRVALMAGSADVVVSDWPFVAVQRAAGNRLCFAPFSSSLGGVMVGPNSPVRSLADLRGRRLGVAGGPVDKSWLVVQAAARATQDLDLAAAAKVVYGAPPLLNAKLLQGELDAVLTFWTFAARAEAAGGREIVSVADCAAALGLPRDLTLVGFVFHEDWANDHRAAIDGFLAAAAEAERTLAAPDADWRLVRPLMDAPDPALFAQLKARFVAGIAHPSAEAEERTAARLFDILLRTGGTRATGGLSALPPGIFWHMADGRA